MNICANLILRKGNNILLGLRHKVAFGSGYYSIISGKVEVGETALEAAIREAKEEASITLEPEKVSFHTFVYSIEEKGAHGSVFFTAREWKGDIKNRERNKIRSWQFFPVDQLPTNLLPYVATALEGIDGTKPHDYYREYRWKESRSEKTP